MDGILFIRSAAYPERLRRPGLLAMRVEGCVPYNVLSVPINGGCYSEHLRPGCFCNIKSGFTSNGEPITATINHSRIIAATAGHRRLLRLKDTPQGLQFTIDNFQLPRACSGSSFRFRAIRWRKIGLVYELLAAELRHIAILITPDVPAYSQTRNLIREVI
jgi:hypothetical protein